MRYWVLYFLCIVVVVSGTFFAAEKIVDSPDIPIISVSLNGEITEMTVEEFALRVLVAEGINCESIETKKALAVSARSCGVYLSLFGCKHDGFDACDNKDCCFNLGDPIKAKSEYLKECVLATQETLGFCLTFEGMPAMALFSLCNGSGSVDCEEFGYITAVKEETTCEVHIKESVLDFSVFKDMTGCEKEALTENSVVVYGDNRKCEFAILGGRYVTADEISTMLLTQSREFVLSFEEEGIHTKSYGIGNGFGLSLCGSDAKAKMGWNFEEIIENYYPNLTLNKIY